jgi:3-isopropylmalate dehydrogenase
MLRYSLGQPDAAAAIEGAVSGVLAAGLRTIDIASAGTPAVKCSEMGEAVALKLG